MNFEQKFIAFIDILGFKKFVEKAELENDFSLNELLQLVSFLHNENNYKNILEYGPIICPQSDYLEKDLSFKVTQISDCVISSSEISPAGLINLINHSFSSILRLLQKGIMCRGYITKGSIHHQNNQVIGSGYQKAYEKESLGVVAFQNENDKNSTPFVEIDPTIKDYLNDIEDDCVKKQFEKMTKSKDELIALFPFSHFTRLTENEISSVNFELEESKNIIELEKSVISKIKFSISERVENASSKAKRKAKYYVEFLDQELEYCNELEKDVQMFNSPLNFT